MKANQLALVLFFLMSGVAIAQQTNSASDGINSETFAELKSRAEKGDAHWQYLLGGCYAFGQGVPQNYAEAVKWFRKAAEQGNTGAQYSLGVSYRNGQGVAKDDTEAAKWYRKAAEQGDAEAQYNLGQMYLKGEGVTQDYAEAVKWYRKAAEQGEVNSQYNLGLAYGKGDGVPQNDIEAYVWLSLAAAQGDKDAPQNRDIVAGRMSREEIAEGQRRAAAFVLHRETPSSNSNSGSPVAAGSPIAAGTGFFITDDGYLISNYHVVKDAAQVRLVTSAGTIPAKVVQVDAANDLALLKANAEGRMQNAETFKPLPVISSRGVKLGGTVATVGFPDPGLQGFAPKLAKGEIAALSGAEDDARYFQISAPVQPGNSGGALVDAAGNVVRLFPQN